MYCPNCSTEASTDQKFCRACGMELQAIAALVTGQSNLVKPEKPTDGVFHGRQRAILIWGLILTLGAVAVGSSLKLLSKEHIQVAGNFTPYLNVIVLLIAFLGIGLTCYPFLHIISPHLRAREAARKSETTAKLKVELLPEEPTSITEQTTEFLEGARTPARARDTTTQSRERDVLS